MAETKTAGQSRDTRLTFVRAAPGSAPPTDEVSVKILESQSGTSIFDPVLCEIAYRWFCPEGGDVLDPFAGGSVRGIVAGVLGRNYCGIELRPEQVASNREQATKIFGALRGTAPPVVLRDDDPISDPDVLTPVQSIGDAWVKRDDLLDIGGVRGGKVRSCAALAGLLGNERPIGLVTAGSRSSPQVNIVAHIAREMGIPCRVHIPSGKLSPELEAARDAGAEIVQHKPGYNTVIVARARADAEQSGFREIPFGMECRTAVTETARQVANIPDGVSRIVVAVGSGMSLAGILTGLAEAGRDIPVLGVVVGADPTERLDQYAPRDWRDRVTLIPSGTKYETPDPEPTRWGILLDAHYEAKAARHVGPGDLFWIVGVRQTAEPSSVGATPARTAGVDRSDLRIPEWVVGDSHEVIAEAGGADRKFDFMLSCPPYGDLEVYSDDPADLSNMPAEEFLQRYRTILGKACRRMRQNRFAMLVVGDYRDQRGFYRNFVAETTAAMEAGGMRLYNEGVLITAIGSLPLRIGRQFRGFRKWGKTHQNVLVYFNGDPRKIKEEFGDVAVPDEEIWVGLATAEPDDIAQAT